MTVFKGNGFDVTEYCYITSTGSTCVSPNTEELQASLIDAIQFVHDNNIDMSDYDWLNPYKKTVYIIRPLCPLCEGYFGPHHLHIIWGFTSLPEVIPDPGLVELVRDDTTSRVTATFNGWEARVLKVTKFG